MKMTARRSVQTDLFGVRKIAATALNYMYQTQGNTPNTDIHRELPFDPPYNSQCHTSRQITLAPKLI